MGIIQKMNCVYSHLKINTKAGFELVRNKRRRSVVCIFFSHKLFADFSPPTGTRAREWNGVKCVPNKPTLFEKEKKKSLVRKCLVVTSQPSERSPTCKHPTKTFLKYSDSESALGKYHKY